MGCGAAYRVPRVARNGAPAQLEAHVLHAGLVLAELAVEHRDVQRGAVAAGPQLSGRGLRIGPRRSWMDGRVATVVCSAGPGEGEGRLGVWGVLLMHYSLGKKRIFLWG